MELILTQEEAEAIIIKAINKQFGEMPTFNQCAIDKEYSYSRIVCTLSVKGVKDEL